MDMTDGKRGSFMASQGSNVTSSQVDIDCACNMVISGRSCMVVARCVNAEIHGTVSNSKGTKK